MCLNRTLQNFFDSNNCKTIDEIKFEITQCNNYNELRNCHALLNNIIQKHGDFSINKNEWGFIFTSTGGLTLIELAVGLGCPLSFIAINAFLAMWTVFACQEMQYRSARILLVTLEDRVNHMSRQNQILLQNNSKSKKAQKIMDIDAARNMIMMLR